MITRAAAVDVFIASAANDRAFLGELKKSLTPLENLGAIRVLDPHALDCEMNVNASMAMVQRAGVILLLVSNDYFSCSECVAQQNVAIQRHRIGHARVIPVIVRPCDWKTPALAGLVPLPHGATPVTSWGSRDAAWLDVTAGLREAVRQAPSRRGEVEGVKQTRLFLHFFDFHLQRLLTAAPQRLRDECELAARLSMLMADEVHIPASSFLENPMCRGILGRLGAFFRGSTVFLVGRGTNLDEFLEAKRLQNPPGTPFHEAYGRPLPAAIPPFRGRSRSATMDIASGWLRRLEVSGAIESVFHGTDVRIPSDIRRRWRDVPPRLAREPRGFVVDYVAPLLLGKKYSRPIRSRIQSIINEEYVRSFTEELGAGVVVDLAYLRAPHPVPSSGVDLSYRELFGRCSGVPDLLKLIREANGDGLLKIKHQDHRWADVVARYRMRSDL